MASKMDFHSLTCRLCLCKCENPRDMLVDAEFASKVQDLFPVVQISTQNGLSSLVCDYCYDIIQQFHGYAENVNRNQRELRKVERKEEIFALPIAYAGAIPNIKVDTELHEEEDKDIGGWFDMEHPFEDFLQEKPKKRPPKPKRKEKKYKKINEVKLLKEELENLDYDQLVRLPPSYTTSYACPLCPKKENEQYDSKSEVKQHLMESHLWDLEFKERFSEAQQLVAGLEIQCDICRKPIKKKNIDHKFIHYDIQPYECDLCPFRSATKAILRRHCNKHLADNRKAFCFYCKVEFPSLDSRKTHILECHADQLMTCDFCGEKLLGRYGAKIHFRKHQQQRLTIECDRCPGGVRFHHERVLAMHKEQHAREDKSRKRLSCHLCERKFNSDNVFEKHLQFHERGHITACHICGKSVQTNSYFQITSHAVTHQKPRKEYKCEECDEVFANRYKLTRHGNEVHNLNKLSCHLCGKVFAEHYMKRHLAFCNSGELKCTHCPMTFTKESARQLHNNKFHTGFKCKRCNIVFENRTQMDAHQRYDEFHVRTKSRKNVVKKIKRSKMQ